VLDYATLALGLGSQAATLTSLGAVTATGVAIGSNVVWVNDGTVSLNSLSGSSYPGTAFVNNGLLNALSSTTVSSVAIDNNGGGTITASAGNVLNLDGGGTLGGTIGGGGGGTVSLGGTYMLAANASTAVAFGTGAAFFDATLSDAAPASGSATLVSAGSVSISEATSIGGSVNWVNDGTVADRGGLSGSGTFTNAGTLSETTIFNAGHFANTGSVSLSSGAELESFSGGTLGGTITGAGAISLGGNWIFANGAVFEAAKLYLGKSTSLAGGVTATGTVLLSSADTLTIASQILKLGGNGTLTVSAGGTLNLQKTADIKDSSSGNTVTNAGLLEHILGTGTSEITASFSNSGTIEVTSGTLAFTGGFTNTGTIIGTETTANGTVYITATTTDLAGLLDHGSAGLGLADLMPSVAHYAGAAGLAAESAASGDRTIAAPFAENLAAAATNFLIHHGS
jgi:hypothetical protein